jgi:peptide/nickel transport system substrate-binding protein
MPLFAWIVALSLTVGASLAHAQPTQITIVQPAEATTMDPGRSTQVLTVNYFYNLYDSLLRWDTALQLQPGLATAWRAVNDTTWEFTLRPGVKFHDGAPLTAEDVRATLERNLVPGKTVVTAGFTTIESVQAVTPTLVRVITKKSDPLLPVRMAQMGSQILPARLTTDDGVKELARRPVGSGAYRFVEWVKDERLVMEANRDWWGWEGRAPAIDRVVWKAIPDDFPRLVALEKGDADIVTSLPPDRVKSIAEGRNTRVVSVPSSRTVEFNINSTQPPLSDKRVRQAMHYALDVPAIIRSLFGGLGKPMAGALADTDFGYNAAIKPYAYNPARARALLGEAGLAGGIDG